MKKVLITSFLLVFMTGALLAQDGLKDDGFNLKTLCPPEKCKYIAWDKPTYFPFEEDREWQINNMEIGIKPSGKILITGDLHVYGEDTAAIIQLEFVFVDEQDNDLTSFKTEKFEFFNEPGNAEPIVFLGEIPGDMAKNVSYVITEMRHSERVPYYEISSSCFLACKNIKLKDSMKAFKKAK